MDVGVYFLNLKQKTRWENEEISKDDIECDKEEIPYFQCHEELEAK